MEETKIATQYAEEREFAIKLLKRGKTTLEEISEYTELTLEELQELIERLKGKIADCKMFSAKLKFTNGIK